MMSKEPPLLSNVKTKYDRIKKILIDDLLKEENLAAADLGIGWHFH